MKNREQRRKLIKTPWFFVALLSFLIIILLVIYIIYLRFIPYMTIEYDGYAVSGKDIATNLLNSTFDVETSIKALEVKDQDSIYKNLNSYYIGASKDENINLDYPIYINNSLAAYNLSSDVTLITDEFEQIDKDIAIINEIPNISDVEPMSYCLDNMECRLNEDKTTSTPPIEELLRNSGQKVGREVQIVKVVG